MRITFHGAARTTTGSMHLLAVNGKRILLECGLYQGKRKDAFERNRNIPFDPSTIDVVLLSHAHIDHSGNLPTLVRRGFRGPILATPATRDLCAIMLLDSAHLQERDVYYVNKRRARQGKRLFEPLYTADDVFHALEHFHKLPMEKPTEVVPGVTVTYHDSGHILGSVLMTLDLDEKGRKRRMLFTGDMGRKDMPIIRDPYVVHDVDILLTESTYGNRVHPPHEDVKKALEELVKKVKDRRSRLLIPAFSVGRTQRILYRLHELWEEGRLEEIPVYVDSPLSVKATYIYEEHPECYDKEMKIFSRESDEPFSFGKVRFVRTPEESKRLNGMKGPMVIISASGMCEGGRVLHHLEHTLGDSRNIVLFVGYQAEHTLGRRLVDGITPVRIYGEEMDVRAEIHSIQALSAHADRNELLSYFKQMGPEVDQAFVVHGEPDQSEPFAEALKKLGAREVSVPARDTTVKV